MSETPAPFILDFLEWLAIEPRRYADVMDSWRTACPRLTVWEDAVDQGYVARRRSDGIMLVDLTPLGRRFLAASGRSRAATHGR